MRVQKLLVAMAIALLPATNALAQSEKKEIDWTKELSSRIEFHGYVQGGFNYDDKNGENNNTFNLARTLLWIDAKVTDRWSFRIMNNFNSKLSDVYSVYKVSDALSIKAGQFKTNYTIESIISPTVTDVINNYSQAVTFLSGYSTDVIYGTSNGGRDLGIEIGGKLLNGHLYYNAAVMNGQGIVQKDKNKYKDVILKLDVRPIEELRLVAGGQIGKGCAIATASYNPDIEVGDNYKRNRLAAGAEYKSKPITVRAEYLRGWDGDVESQGAYCTVKVPITPKLEAVAVVDYFDKNIDMSLKQTNYAVALHYWFYKKCRLQLQYTRCAPNTMDDYNMLQTQLQFAF